MGHRRHEVLEEIAEMVDGMEVVMPPDLEPYQMRLLATLNVRVRFDPNVQHPRRGRKPWRERTKPQS